MNAWYAKGIGDGMTASLSSDEIKETFLRSFQAKGTPPDMAVFTRLGSEGRLHCEVMAYFSPAAQEVAKSFHAQPCAKPSRMRLDLLAGNAKAWSVLFDDMN